MIGFLVGLVLGANGGLILAAMLCAASRGPEAERARKASQSEGDGLAAHGMGEVRVGPAKW